MTDPARKSEPITVEATEVPTPAKPANDTALVVAPAAQPPAVAKVAAPAPLELNTSWDIVRSIGIGNFAKAAADAGWFKVASKEQALMCLTYGMELGIGPVASLRDLYVIGGRPAMYADAMVAMCMSKRALCEYFYCESADEKHATYVTQRVGYPVPIKRTFTIKDAEKAELLKNAQYATRPETMLRHRAAAMLAREVYPDLVRGIYTPEEAEEIAGHRVPQLRQKAVAQ